MSIRVLDPTLGPEAEEARLAPSLRALKGSTIGLLDNNKHNVARFLDHLEDILRSQYGVQDVVRREKHDASRPVPKEILGELAACDAIISAVGD